jgi:hypothetical protein
LKGYPDKSDAAEQIGSINRQVALSLQHYYLTRVADVDFIRDWSPHNTTERRSNKEDGSEKCVV